MNYPQYNLLKPTTTQLNQSPTNYHTTQSISNQLPHNSINLQSPPTLNYLNQTTSNTTTSLNPPPSVSR